MHAAAPLVLIASLLLWAGNWIVARAVRDEISPGIANHFAGIALILAGVALSSWRISAPA